jgi:putative membrane protein
VDTTIGAATQLIFVMSGAALLLMRSTDRGAVVVASAVLIGTNVFLVAVAAFIVFQHRGLFGVSAKLTRRLLPQQWLSVVAAGASAIDNAVVASYRAGPVILVASVLRLIAWAVEAAEIWLVMQALGQPLGIIDAFILESLSSGVRGAAFIVPSGLGALEGGLVMLGALFGLPPETALAISLSKRVRELALGLPGLFVWNWIEGHHLLRWNGRRREADGGDIGRTGTQHERQL